MHTNYYYIRQVSERLREKLTGWTLAACFSQEKDELILGFCSENEEFYIKAILKPDFACLVFPADFQRARKNSIDLFKEIADRRITDVIQYRNERSFALVFEENWALLFKMHGNRSNIILLKDDQTVSLFNNKLISDQNMYPPALHRDLDQTFEAFTEAHFRIERLYPTFGKGVMHYLTKTENFASSPPQMQWKRIQELVQVLEHPIFYITLLGDTPALMLLPVGTIQSQTDDAIKAANLFYQAFAKVTTLEGEKKDAIRLLEKKKTQTQNYLTKTYEKLASFEKEARNEHIAHILMANLHAIPPHAESVELHDFYHDRPIRIKLKKDLNAQKNAEVYYRKAKNEKIEIQKLEEAIERKENELEKLQGMITHIAAMENLKELRKYLKEHGIHAQKEAVQPDELFKRYEHLGFEIWVGKNAKNNDLLTQQYAFKEDLWLHAKDVTGSHVIIKYQAGKNFPEPVIEKAARLAAYFSKLKNDSVCPVIVTPKKYVRKPKGLPDGAVVVDKEKVILVEPSPT